MRPVEKRRSLDATIALAPPVADAAVVLKCNSVTAGSPDSAAKLQPGYFGVGRVQLDIIAVQLGVDHAADTGAAECVVQIRHQIGPVGVASGIALIKRDGVIPSAGCGRHQTRNSAALPSSFGSTLSWPFAGGADAVSVSARFCAVCAAPSPSSRTAVSLVPASMRKSVVVPVVVSWMCAHQRSTRSDPACSLIAGSQPR